MRGIIGMASQGLELFPQLRVLLLECIVMFCCSRGVNSMSLKLDRRGMGLVLIRGGLYVSINERGTK